MSAASASPPALAPGAGRRRKSCSAASPPAGKRARHFRPWRAAEPATTAAHQRDRLPLPPSPPPTSGESRLSSPPPRCDLTPPTSSASPTPPPPPAKPDSPAHCSRLVAPQSPPPTALSSFQDGDPRHQSTPPTAPPILLRLPHTLTPPDGADVPSLRHSPPPPTLAPPPQLLLRVPPTHPYTALELRPAPPPLPLPLGAAPPPVQPRFAPPTLSPGPSAAAGRAPPDPLQSEPLSLVLRPQAPPRDPAPPPRDAPPPPPTPDPAPQTSPQGPRNYKNMTRERRIEANARERTRVHTISAAFDTLRRAVPSYAHAQKLSKLSVLRIASAYIMTLARVAGYDYSPDGSQPSLAECVDQVSRTIQTEGRLRRKKDD